MLQDKCNAMRHNTAQTDISKYLFIYLYIYVYRPSNKLCTIARCKTSASCRTPHGAIVTRNIQHIYKYSFLIITLTFSSINNHASNANQANAIQPQYTLKTDLRRCNTYYMKRTCVNIQTQQDLLADLARPTLK